MNKFLRSRVIRTMMPYFLLIVGAIIFFRVSEEFRFFTDVVGRFWATISPFLVGAIIAYILNIPCCGLQKLIERLSKLNKLPKKHIVTKVVNFIVRKSRIFSVLLLVIIAILIISLLLNILIPAVSDSIELFIGEFEDYEATIRDWIFNLNQHLPETIAENIDEDIIITTLTGWVGNLDFASIGGTVISGLGGFASTVFSMFLSIVSSLYLLIEKDKLKGFALKVVKALTTESTNATILKYSRKLDFNFRQYVFAQTIDGLILGSIMTVILFFFTPQYAIVLGLILGIVNYIPYFGSIFGTALAVLVIAFTQGIPTAAIAAIIMFGVQQLDGNYIQPRLMGKTFALSPLLIIISVTIGMQYGGILGMLVAIPIVAILKDMLDMYLEHREKTKNDPKPDIDDYFDTRLF